MTEQQITYYVSWCYDMLPWIIGRAVTCTLVAVAVCFALSNSRLINSDDTKKLMMVIAFSPLLLALTALVFIVSVPFALRLIGWLWWLQQSVFR
jgi:hypothetical protein